MTPETDTPLLNDDVDRQLEKDMKRLDHAFANMQEIYPASTEINPRFPNLEALQRGVRDCVHLSLIHPETFGTKTTLYGQAMSSVIPNLLLGVNDEEKGLRAFGLLLQVYNLTEIFDADQFRNSLQTNVRTDVLWELILECLPGRAKIMKRAGVGYSGTTMLTMLPLTCSWFTTLFMHARVHPEVKLRILDTFFEHGWKGIFAIALSIVEYNIPLELGASNNIENEVIDRLQDFHRFIPPDQSEVLLGPRMDYFLEKLGPSIATRMKKKRKQLAQTLRQEPRW
jgi:hypothetical protein